MATWKCKRCTTVFTVGAPNCPNIECKARDAFEIGGDPEANVYDLPEYGPIEDDPVAQRLGLVPGDPGAADSSSDPDPVEELPVDLDDTGEQLPDAVEGDMTEHVAPARKRQT